jgi:tetratricopeptide (TPR) repeat protein
MHRSVPIALALALAAAASLAQSPAPGSFDALLKQGFELHRAARFAEALPLLQQAQQLRPRDYFANLLVGIDLLRTGQPSKAVARLQLAARLRPGEEIAPEYLGEAQADLGHFAAAVVAYRQAVERTRGSQETQVEWASFALERFRALGEELRATDDGMEAQKRLAAGAEPASPECAAGLPVLESALALKRTVKTEEILSVCYAAEAGRAVERVASAAGGSAAVHRLRGDIQLLLATDGKAAEAEYRQALLAEPRDPALLARLASAQLEAGDSEAARGSARQALAIDPHRADALRALARVAMNERDYPAALPFLRLLRQEAPGDRQVQIDLGRALAQTGDNANAERELAGALGSGYPDRKGALHAILAGVLRRLGRTGEAAQMEAEARRLSDASQARPSAASAQHVVETGK